MIRLTRCCRGVINFSKSFSPGLLHRTWYSSIDLPLKRLAYLAGRINILLNILNHYGKTNTIPSTSRACIVNVKSLNIPNISTKSCTACHCASVSFTAVASRPCFAYQVSIEILNTIIRYSILYTLPHLVAWSRRGLNIFSFTPVPISSAMSSPSSSISSSSSS